MAREFSQEEIQQILEQNQKLSDRIGQLEAEVQDLREGLEVTSSRASGAIKRFGSWVKEQIDFGYELATEDIKSAKVYFDALKDNAVELTERIGESTKDMFDTVKQFFTDKVPMPFGKVLDFAIKKFDAEIDAHFLEADTKQLNIKEKLVLAIGLAKGKIQDEKEEWLSALRHDGWKLAEKLGLHQERNKELGNKLLQSTKLFGEAIKGIGEVAKEIPQPAVAWVKTNLINTIPKSVDIIKNAVDTSKDYVKKAFTLSVPEFFKACKEGVEKAIADKQGYEVDLVNGGVKAPTIEALVKNKYQETFAPVVDKIKNTTHLISGWMKNHGKADVLANPTQTLSRRGVMLGLEEIPIALVQNNVERAEVEAIMNKLNTVQTSLTPNADANNIQKNIVDVTNTIDETVGVEFVRGTEALVKQEEIRFAVVNDLQLKPVEMTNTDACETYIMSGVNQEISAQYPELNSANWNFAYFHSEANNNYIVKADVISNKGEITSFLFDTKDLENPIRVNYQKEIGMEARTVYDKANGVLSISAINNIPTLKHTLDAIPSIKESIEKDMGIDNKDSVEASKDNKESIGKE